MFIHNLNPVLFDFIFFEIRWYSLAYIFGILIGWWLAKKIIVFKINTGQISFNPDLFDELISYIVISIIIGGRIGYVIFYNLTFYIDNPINIFKIWEGGMSFHGALIGIILATLIFANKKKLDPLIFLDIISAVAPIGLFFGRIANFINSELYGKPTDFFFSVVFTNVDKLPRHPSQLYEATLEGLILFVILIFTIFNKNFKRGTCSCLFLILYGFFRIIGEQFREPDIQIGYLFNKFSMGTMLSVFMVVVGILILKKNNYDKK